MFGSRPWLASRPPSETKRRAASTRLSSSIASVSGRSESRSSALARLGDIDGSSWKPSAAAPATTGAAIEVPPARMYSPPPVTHSSHSLVYSEPGARLETILAPGA